MAKYTGIVEKCSAVGRWYHWADYPTYEDARDAVKGYCMAPGAMFRVLDALGEQGPFIWGSPTTIKETPAPVGADLPSLTATGGWCAPTEWTYDMHVSPPRSKVKKSVRIAELEKRVAELEAKSAPDEMAEVDSSMKSIMNQVSAWGVDLGDEVTITRTQAGIRLDLRRAR